MKILTPENQRDGSTLVVTLSVVATVLVLLGSAVGYTQHISKVSQRSRQTALAMEIADGHLEALFTNWRNIARVQVQAVIKKQIVVSVFSLPTQYFFTDCGTCDSRYNGNPGPAPTPNPATTGLTAAPPLIPLPAKSNFPTEPNYLVNQYRIQAVDPTITLNANETSSVPVDTEAQAAFGPNTSRTNGQYSYFYLASADISVPSMGGAVQAKVRRVFEKKYDMPFNFAMLYLDDLEFHPATNFSLTGPIQTNANLYIGNSKFIVAAPTTANPRSGRVAYSTSYVNGPSPLDPLHPASSATPPTFAPDQPPAMNAPYLPFGWNLNLDASTANNQNYHELIERAVSGTDPIASVRFSKQADYSVLINDSTPPNNIMIYDKTGAAVAKNTGDGKVINEALTTSGIIDQSIIYDGREGGPVRVTSINIGDVSAKSTLGMIYIADTTAGTNSTLGGVTTSRKAIKIRNGANLIPTAGLTIVSENPVYIQGNYNTGTWRPSAIVADAITVLSNAWNDTTSVGLRFANDTTVNAALITGNVPSDGMNYSGGGENFIRFLENWSGRSFTYSGSMVQMWQSKQGVGPWTNSSSVYTAPTNNNWFYDTRFENIAPPGNFQIAAYLQQQRWYQVY